MAALAVLGILPRIEIFDFIDGGRSEVEDVIRRSKQTVLDCSSKYHHLTIPRSSLLTLPRSQTYDR